MLYENNLLFFYYLMTITILNVRGPNHVIFKLIRVLWSQYNYAERNGQAKVFFVTKTPVKVVIVLK